MTYLTNWFRPSRGHLRCLQGKPVIQVKSYENDSDLYDTVCWSLQVQLFDGTDLVLSEIIYLSIENEKKKKQLIYNSLFLVVVVQRGKAD